MKVAFKNSYIQKQNLKPADGFSFAAKNFGSTERNTSDFIAKARTCVLPSSLHLGAILNINFTGNIPQLKEESDAPALKFEPVTKTRPIFKPCLEYDDIDVFSEKFVKKIETQLMNPSIDDIERMIFDIQNETNAPRDLILKVLWRLTQFSSYDSLSVIEKAAEDNNIEFATGFNSLSINSVLSYLAYSKFEFALPGKTRMALFADDLILQSFEKAKDGASSFSQKCDYTSACDFVDSDASKIYILDGFDVKASDGKYYSTGFIAGSGYLKSLAADVVKRVEAGEELDEVLNGDLIKRLKNVFPKLRSEPFIIKKSEPEQITPETILGNLRAKNIDKNYVKACLELLTLRCNKDVGYNPRIYQKAMMKYLDNFCFVFSPASLELEMKKTGRKIQQISSDKDTDIIFCVPEKLKSYGLVTYAYAKNNHIPAEKIVSYFGD